MNEFSKREKPGLDKFIRLFSKLDDMLSARQKRILFYVFFLSMSIYFLALLINPFILADQKNNYQTPFEQGISPPLDVSLPDSLNIYKLREHSIIQKLRDTITPE